MRGPLRVSGQNRDGTLSFEEHLLALLDGMAVEWEGDPLFQETEPPSRE